MKQKLLYAAAVLLASVILNQGLQSLQIYLYNRQYDVSLHQKAWEREWNEYAPLKEVE